MRCLQRVDEGFCELKELCRREFFYSFFVTWVLMPLMTVLALMKSAL